MAKTTTKSTSEISEVKIRQAIWMLKANKTKKSICEHLGIAYNTKRLDSLIQEFQAKEKRISDLRKTRSKTPFSKDDMQSIVDDYNNGESQSSIAERWYTSPQRIKNVLIEMNIPIRARSKTGEAKVDHVVQDLDIILKKNDRVFVPKKNVFGIIDKVFDEDWVDYYKQPTKRRYIELNAMEYSRKLHGAEYEGVQGTDYEIYCCYDNGDEWKESAIKAKLSEIETIIEQTGREYYSIWIEGDFSRFSYERRENLIPIKGK